MLDVDRAFAALQRVLASEPGLAVQRLPEDQLVIAKDLVANPEPGFKSSRLVPDAGGFEIYVKVDRGAPSPLPPQRPGEGDVRLAWNDAATILRQLRGALDHRWEVQGRHARVAIAVHCGSAAAFDSAERVLMTVGRVMFEEDD